MQKWEGLVNSRESSGGEVVVIFDLDGTVRENGARKPPRGVSDALQSLNKQGVRIFIATGKAEALVRTFVRRYVIPVSGVCCEDGGILRVFICNHLHSGGYNDESGDVSRIQRHFRECEECGGGAEQNTPRARIESRKATMVTRFFPSAESAARRVEVVKRHAEAICNHTVVVFSHNDGGLDVKPAGSVFNKGALADWLGHEFSDNPHRVVLFMGDGDNDMPLLAHREVTHVGCPQNSTPGVKSIVESRRGFVASRVHGKGTLDILDHYLSMKVLPDFHA